VVRNLRTQAVLKGSPPGEMGADHSNQPTTAVGTVARSAFCCPVTVSLRESAGEMTKRHPNEPYKNGHAMAGALGAHKSWANTKDRTARTEPGRQGLMEKFRREVDPEGKLSPAEREKRAENAKKAFFLDLALKSARARSARAKARKAASDAKQLRAELDGE
jgi:hypothetical protein